LGHFSHKDHNFSAARHVFHGDPMAVIAVRRPPERDFAVPAVSLGLAALLMAGMYFGTEPLEHKANAAKQGSIVISGSFSVGSQGDYSAFSGQRIAPQRPAAR
jgi:hypothetical protein